MEKIAEHIGRSSCDFVKKGFHQTKIHQRIPNTRMIGRDFREKFTIPFA